MSSTPPTGGRLLVEPLEARIAPTGLTAIANNTAFTGSTQPYYVSYATTPSASHLGFVKASTYLGASAPSNLYAIKMSGDGSSNGDKLLIFNSTTGFNPTNPFLQATDQTLIAFFKDTNGDGQVQANELVGLSLTKKSSANINGNVNGDIVTNLSKDGTTISLNSVGKAGFEIAGLTINGNVTGDILAGGNINHVSVSGVANIFAGTATNGVSYHFAGPGTAATGKIVEGAFPDARIGASITGLTVTSIASADTIRAGAGGMGAVGGDVVDLTVLADTAGFKVLAGDGGVGTSTIKGGVGGNISTATIVGTADTGDTHLITLQAGDGGRDSAFKGGVGGSVFGVATSFDQFDPSTLTGAQSADLLTQRIVVQAGAGGDGLKGGRGGDVTDSSVFSAAPDVDGVANAEIQVLAGAGGARLTPGQGHGGKGGNVSQVSAEDLDTNTDGITSTVKIEGGAGGAGKDGGSLSGINLLGSRVIAEAGNGGAGILTGGPGGSVDTINILSLTDLFTHQLTLNAGTGGACSVGAGGAGGNIDTVKMLDADLNLLVINSGTHADGGAGSGGAGGAGGSVSNVQLTDSDLGGQFATATVRSGAGGNGHTDGGNGGSFSQLQMFGLNFSVLATAGAGGNGSGGAGGNGGGFNTVGFSSVPTVDQIAVGGAVTIADALGSDYTQQTGVVTAGNGGAGTTQGGAGGNLSTVDVRTSYNVTLTAGAGGAGQSSAGGEGGTISASAGVSLGGAVSAIAGKGSASGTLPADGGSITGVIASAETNIVMTAGNGGFGGNGGDITGSGTSLNPLFSDASNFGSVKITAGTGSSANGTAGTGGSVTVFNGSVGLGGTTAITAGAGGGGTGHTASGAGGNVDQIKLTGNSGDFGGAQLVTIDGGAAGQATAAANGAAGGSVSNVTIYDLDTGTVVQHIAAGDAANGSKRGGAGGTITEIHVGRPGDFGPDDIGVRSGKTFGYATNDAGGLFAGVGGTGPTKGLNGDVTDITATAIASIVAGKTSTIHLVNKVDGIDLEGNTASAATTTGAFTNFDTANIVGSVYNDGNGPTAAGASAFKRGDGLIAALDLTSNRDFTPEALLTVDSSGKLEFADYRQPTATPVLTHTIPVTAAL